MKLVAADMDGPLLDSQKRVPARLLPVVRVLKDRGVRFAVASGRQYYALLSYFPGLEDELLFLAENGSLVFDGRENIYTSRLQPQPVREAVEYLRGIEGTGIMLCGVKSAYY